MANIYVSSGGNSKLEFFTALIDVTYPEGSTCTCSNGTKTLKAKGTSSKYLFNVEPGTWTVSCTDGIDTVSKSVEITSEGQIASVTLKYNFYLFKSGVGAVTPFRTDIESGAKCVIGTDSIKMTVSDLDSGYSLIETESPVDLTNYSTLVMQVKDMAYDRSVTGLYIAKKQSADFDSVSATAKKTLKDVSGVGTFTLNISSRSGNFYIGINGVWSGEILNWYLE